MQDFEKDIFGLPIKIQLTHVPDGIPLYMSTRNFYLAEGYGIKFFLVELREKEPFGTIALEKQLAKYMEASKTNVAYVVPSLTKRQRDALINRMIPFVSMPNQIFLPFLGVALENRFRKEEQVRLDRFTPASQSLYLYFLYNRNVRELLKKDAATALHLTRTSITRASEQLVKLGLIQEKVTGTEIRMMPVAQGREFYELGMPYFINPVTKVMTVQADESLKECVMAGESALAERSMLNRPRIPSIAVWREDSILESLVEVDPRWETDTSALKVEIWKYDPKLFAREGMVDPVSMAQSLSDEKDERVRGELNQYLEGYKW